MLQGDGALPRDRRMMVTTQYRSQEDAVDACASLIVSSITDALATSSRTSFMASGGRIPAQVLPRVASNLSCWDRILVLASDERYVPVDHTDSNERTIRDGLALAGHRIDYLGLDASLPLAVACRAYERQLSTLVWPPAVAFLGIGADAHTASLFPHRPEIEDEVSRVLPVPETPPHLHARLTHGVRSLLEAQQIVLIVNGPEKQAALQRAVRDDAKPSETPITRILKDAKTPVHVMLC
jgi:6-phosphogluconolactonase